MVPFLSRRSITILLLGLIVGALGGLGFWAISPVEVKTEMGWPPINFESEPDSYESTVVVEFTGPGADYYYVKSLQREGEYYAAKMETSSFLEFLSEAVSSGKYAHTPEELGELIRIRYGWNSESPSVEIRATSPDEMEAFYLAGITPEVFKDYLTALELDEQQRVYQKTVEAFESISAALVEARIERADLAAQAGVDLLVADPIELEQLQMNLAYVVVDAQVRALEGQLNALSQDLLSLSNGDSPEPEVLSRLVVGEPSDPTSVARDRMRGRNVLMIGALFGVALAWIGVNYKGLKGRISPAPAAIVRLREWEEEEEETEE
jgi:hypothetical protein